MSFLATLKSWALPRRKLLAGVVGVAVETAAAAVPGVNLAAKFLGGMIEKATEAVLDPDTRQPIPPEQMQRIDEWLAALASSYGGLLDHLEQMHIQTSASLEQVTLSVKQAIEGSTQLATQFDACLVAVRQQTLSLALMERKLDEHFHVQLKMNASLEEIKRLYVESPMAGDWATFRKARPEAVQMVVSADEHFLAGRREEGAAAVVKFLRERGVTDRTLAHLLGLVELGRGRTAEAKARLDEAVSASADPKAMGGTAARLSTLSGRSGGLGAWRSLPRGCAVGRKYRVEAEIGRGGMASVYRAESTLSFAKEKFVAIKVPAPALMADEGTRRRFEREIQVSLQLSEGRHPNIVRVNECEVFDDPFTGKELYGLVMELVDGMSLLSFLAERRQRNERMKIAEVRNVMTGVAEGLKHAHGQGVLHRDVKPHNVMVARGPVIKLMDFGIARVLEESREAMTQAGAVVGTLAYMPREMLCPDSGNPVSVRTDVFMLGVLLREMLTFSPGGSLKTREDCPEAWRALVKDATQDDQDDRPESVAAFLARFAETGTPAKSVVVPPVVVPVAPPPVVVAPPTPVAKAKPAALAREIVNSIGMKLVLIPAGTFMMGSPDNEADRSPNEGPQHEVEISKAFYLGVLQVTQAEYLRVMGKIPSYFSATGGGKDQVKGLDTSKFPVEQVSWDEAVEFCRKLSEMPEEKKNRRTYRLTRECEWEYACRGGPFSSPYQVFHFGNSLSSTQANFDGNHPYGGAAKGPYLGRTCVVGSYPANKLGLHDMHGNVFEWCSDWFAGDYYAKSPRRDPEGPPDGSLRVFRGGGWNSSGQYCRSAYRGYYTPDFRDSALGFRVAAVPSGQAEE